MTDLIPRAAVLAILRTPEALDTFPDMIRRVEALEGGVGVTASVEAVRGVWGRCEALEDEAHAKLVQSEKLTDHEIGFWRGQKLAAKSIRRSTEMPLAALEITPDDVSAQLETCGQCMGSGYGGHPDSGILCYACNGTGATPPDDVSGGEIKRLRAALMWARDRIDVDSGMTKPEADRTCAELLNVLRGGPSPASSFAPEVWQSATAAALASAPPAEQTED